MQVKLSVVHGKPQGKTVIFSRGQYVIGRGSECQLRPNSEWVSRQHCMVRVSEKNAFIRDLGSTNGTLVNGARLIGERRLEDGDRVQVGPLVFEVRFEDSVLIPKPATEQLGHVVNAGVLKDQTTAELPTFKSLEPPIEEKQL